MILNANIPLNTNQPTRQHPWRVGLFLGLVSVGLLLGWIVTKRLFVGIKTPRPETLSGISIRITPENARWLSLHTGGLSINSSCPIDLPTLISQAHISWILVGDTGEKEQVSFKGKLPENLKNYGVAFGCHITSNKKTFSLQEKTGEEVIIKNTVRFTTPDGWAWKGEAGTPITLVNQGLSIHFQGLASKIPTPWPVQELITALPLTQGVFDALPRTWQGLHDLSTLYNGVAFFAWQTNEQELAFAYTIDENIPDDVIIALFYDIGNIPQKTERQFREDTISYTVTQKEKITLIWMTETQGEIRGENKTPIGYITKQDTFTHISTAPTTWTTSIPHWQAPLNKKEENIAHTPHTLANFGTNVFITNNKLTIINKNL